MSFLKWVFKFYTDDDIAGLFAQLRANSERTRQATGRYCQLLHEHYGSSEGEVLISYIFIDNIDVQKGIS